MNLLGIDVGTTATKVGVFDPTGKVLSLKEAPTPVVWDGDQTAHHEAQALWGTVVGLLLELGPTAREVGAIGVSSFGEAGVLVDAKGQPTLPVLAWFDPRPKTEFGRLLDLMPTQQWRSRTGLLPDANYGLCKLLWLKKNHLEVTRKTQWLSVADWIAFKLTGERSIGLTQANRTLALDLRKQCWMDDVLGELGLQDILPEMRLPGEVIGSVTLEAAAQTGLPTGIKVMETGHDQPLAAFGVGAHSAGTLVNSCGTAEVLFAGFDEAMLPRALQAENVAVGANALSGKFYAMASLRASGLVWDWWVRASGHEQGRLLEAAHAVPFGCESLRFLPHLRPLYDNPNQPQLSGGSFVGLREHHGLGHLTRAVLEGLCFECWQLRQNILEAIGNFTPPIRAVGGATRNNLWMQSKANFLQTDLETYSSPHAAAWGAAWLAGHHLGLVDDFQPQPQTRYSPSEEVGEVLEAYRAIL
jgi:sugar (pentulose or hexulose) kinase